MDSEPVTPLLRVGAVAAAAAGTGLILFGSPTLTALGVVLVILGLVSLIPVVGLSLDRWQAA